MRLPRDWDRGVTAVLEWTIIAVLGLCAFAVVLLMLVGLVVAIR